MENDQTKKGSKKRKGIVVSDKMDKTIVVEVITLLTHRKYRKKYKETKRYSVHDPKNLHKVGERVFFCESKPLSKKKKWTVIEIADSK